MKPLADSFVFLGFLLATDAASYQTPQRCLKPVAVGSCTLNSPSWYFDPSTNYCRGFIYGGCYGNSNRFSREEKCQQICLPGAPRKRVCSYPPRKGPCNGRTLSWAYDVVADRCRIFLYGGCKGNANNFKNCTECMQRCSGKRLKDVRKLCTKLTADIKRKYTSTHRPIVGGPE
uniref:BPTI/Kunitz inhibitor domain-containing protein n=1 Tax=Amblyomma tuberculatum TaxID=48802 RepID=A0A6M2E4B7_9ACAR